MKKLHNLQIISKLMVTTPLSTITLLMRNKLPAVCEIGFVIHSYDMTPARVHDLHYLNDIRWKYQGCMMPGEKGYLCAEVQKNLFETVNISREVPYRLNQKNWRPPRGHISDSANALKPYSPN